MKRASQSVALAFLGLSAVVARADGPTVEEPTGFWALFRSENDEVNAGNAQLTADDPKGALAAR